MSLLSQARERLRALFFRAREAQDLAEELRVHLEMEAEANLRRGMSREEARRQALISFGGVQRFKEEVRDARSFELLEDLAQDLRYALRRLTREAHGVILSASLASSLFGHDDPIRRRVRWARPSSDPDYVVVGVVGDVPSQTIRDGPSRVLYFPHPYPPKADTITNVVHD